MSKQGFNYGMGIMIILFSTELYRARVSGDGINTNEDDRIVVEDGHLLIILDGRHRHTAVDLLCAAREQSRLLPSSAGFFLFFETESVSNKQRRLGLANQQFTTPTDLPGLPIRRYSTKLADDAGWFEVKYGRKYKDACVMDVVNHSLFFKYLLFWTCLRYGKLSYLWIWYSTKIESSLLSRVWVQNKEQESTCVGCTRTAWSLQVWYRRSGTIGRHHRLFYQSLTKRSIFRASRFSGSMSKVVVIARCTSFFCLWSAVLLVVYSIEVSVGARFFPPVQNSCFSSIYVWSTLIDASKIRHGSTKPRGVKVFCLALSILGP